MWAGRRRNVPVVVVVAVEVVVVVTLSLVPLADGEFRHSIPVGLIYDGQSGHLPQEVEREVEAANGRPSNIRLLTRTLYVDATDSFNVSRALCSLLSTGAIVLLGHAGRPTLDTIRAYSESLEIPFIFFNNPADPRGRGRGLGRQHQQQQQQQQQPGGLQYYIEPSISKAIVDVIQTYGWSSLTYIYGTDEALFRLEQIHDYTHEYHYAPEISARFVQNTSACLRLLSSLHSENRNRDIRVVLDLEPDDAQLVMDSVLADDEIYKIRFHFVLPYLSLRYIWLKAFKTGGMNITGFELFPLNGTINRAYITHHTERWRPDGIFARDAVSLVLQSLIALQRRSSSSRRYPGHSGNYLFGRINGWRDLYKGNDALCMPSPSASWRYGRDLAQVLTENTWEAESGPIRFAKNGQRTDYHLEVLEVGMYRGVAKVGTWSSDGFEPKMPEQILDKINRTIDNRTRVVISIDDRPYVFNTYAARDGVPVVGRYRFYGYCADLAEMVAHTVGYEYHIRLVRDGQYGAPQGNGSWNGMIGELIRHEADIAFAPLTITSDREKVLDFTKPFMSLGISIMITRPVDTDPHVFSFMEPLSQEIWLCTVFAFIGVSVVLFLVSRFSAEEWSVDSGEGKLSNDFTIGNSLWFSLGAFMQQGCDVLPKSVSGRIVTSVWWFFTLIIISSYTANLAAYLTTMRMSAPIKSAEDLAKQTEIKYGTMASGSTNAFFNQTTVSLYQRMWSFMTSQKNVFVNSNAEGIRKVRESHGKYAFLIESTTNEYHNNRKPCDTMKVGSNLDSKGYGVATPMGSDIRDRLTLSILELREHGELEQLKKYWWFEMSECPAEKGTTKESEDNALTLSKVAGIFYILVAGLALSVISVVLEFLYKTKVDSRRQNISFGSEARSKFRLSISGHSDDESQGQRTPLRGSSTFSYPSMERPRSRTQTVV
ncbi:glutamate receptor-like [Babylonia areolata]|uniref:glutamate receptor-like n=1 Tax=Babylonia areolata TaxID=304850 RepID=UPI003FD26725